MAVCHLPVAVKATSRFFGDGLLSLRALLILEHEDFVLLGKSEQETAKADFRIFNLIVRNGVDCQSREIGRKEISWEAIPLLMAGGGERVNSDNGSRDQG